MFEGTGFRPEDNMNLLTSVVQELRVALGRSGLESKQHLLPLKQLSGGQKARVLFAKVRVFLGWKIFIIYSLIYWEGDQ